MPPLARSLRRTRRIVLPLALAATVLAPLPALADSSADRSAMVRTGDGWVRGEQTPEGRQFLGISYAQPPIGDLRWQAPRPVANWRGVQDATHYGNYCAQNTYWAPGYGTQHTAEDCLTVNVYTPTTGHQPAKLPVMVWIHGGANIGGSGRDIVPDEFAHRTGTVVVTVNYRLGALGFLTLPGTSGNFALLDQQQALRWVQANIDHFGGDRTRVTLAGESAGGSAVCAQLAAPGSRGLYRAAIIQSGAYWDCDATTQEEAVATGLAFAAKLGCAEAATAVDCLRAKTAKEILDAQNGTGPETWRYTAGGEQLPLQPAEAFVSGRAARVPVMNGANSKEGLVFAYDSFDRWGTQLTAEAYPQALTSVFGEQTGAQALDRYPLDAYDRPSYAYAAAFGDYLFACPALRTDDRLAERGRVYAYEFADRTSPLFASLPQNADFDFGATHAAELNYLFKPYGRSATLNPEQRTLAGQMTEYWGSFIRGSVPHAHGQEAMPEQSSRPAHVLQLRTASAGGNAITTGLRAEHQCDLWDAAAATS